MQEGLSIILSHCEKYENLADVYCSFLVDWEILWTVRVLFSSFSSIKEEYKYEYNLKNIQWVSFFKNVYLWVWNISAIHSLACLLSDATWCFSLSKLSFLTMPIENSLCLPRQMKYLLAELFQFFEKTINDYMCIFVFNHHYVSICSL